MSNHSRNACAAIVLLATAVSCQQPGPAREAPATEPSRNAPATTRPVAPPAGAPHWGYEGEGGPDEWGALSPEFSACAAGKHQSPIDITGATSATLPELRASFEPAALRIAHHEHMADAINNGHTIQVNYTEGDSLTVGDMSYELAQYHFHSPSEHTLEGAHFPMEMHLVHKAEDGSLAVVAVFIEEGAHNAAFDPIWSRLPEEGLESHFEGVKVDVDDLLPASRTTYRYDGSLTTPPCSEEVKWLVMTEAIHLSGDQIEAFRALVPKNNRPVQPLNDRSIVTDRVRSES